MSLSNLFRCSSLIYLSSKAIVSICKGIALSSKELIFNLPGLYPVLHQSYPADSFPRFKHSDL